jgi:hypothetical protein
VGLERVHSALVRINDELLERKLAAPLYKTEINVRRGSAPLTTRELALNFIDKWRSSVGIVHSRSRGHGGFVCLFVCLFARLAYTDEYILTTNAAFCVNFPESRR